MAHEQSKCMQLDEDLRYLLAEHPDTQLPTYLILAGSFFHASDWANQRGLRRGRWAVPYTLAELDKLPDNTIPIMLPSFKVALRKPWYPPLEGLTPAGMLAAVREKFGEPREEATTWV